MLRGRPKKDPSAAGSEPPAKKSKANGNGANLGFESQLFLAADKLRKNLEPSDYKHVALGLIFLKHISIAFEAMYAELLAEDALAAEDPDEYLAENVFWVPKEARWSSLQANAKQPTIGKLFDDAMAKIEEANPALKGVLPKDFNRPALDKVMLGELIDLISGFASRPTSVTKTPTCSALFARRAASERRSLCPTPTPRRCNCTLMKSPRPSPAALTPFCFSTAPGGIRPKSSASRKT
jgi:hypothetical protein